ncbi:MAG: hypothetical protein LBU34_10990 [Planctomycetaceae bacterium]|nr:hypothetical protein [Planctomycetaceae bacterium]
MCITVGGAKRNLRIRILQGRQPLGENPSPNGCVVDSRQQGMYKSADADAIMGESPSASNCLPLVSILLEKNTANISLKMTLLLSGIFIIFRCTLLSNKYTWQYQ